MIEVRRDDPLSPAVNGLIAEHLAFSRANTDAPYRFALGGEQLAEPGTIFFTAWDEGTLVGMGALKRLSENHAELKSMRTADGHRRRGVGAAVLSTLIETARRLRVSRVSLETGTDGDFAAARALYSRFGFVECATFAVYPADSTQNLYMTLNMEV